MEQKISILRQRLTNEIRDFNEAVREGLPLAITKELWLKSKATFKELQNYTDEYQAQLSEIMKQFTKNNE